MNEKFDTYYSICQDLLPQNHYSYPAKDSDLNTAELIMNLRNELEELREDILKKKKGKHFVVCPNS